MISVSVIIPTHNPRPDFLRRVVEALAAQTLPASVWDIVIVDNASAQAVIAAMLPPCGAALHVIREDRIGLSFARDAGIATARGALLIFADDDNVLASDFLAVAKAFFDAHPEVGIAGGRIQPEFEISLPPWAQPHLGLLAVRDLGPVSLISNHQAGAPMAYDYFAPIGAGMVVRAEIARRYVHWAAASPNRLADRQGHGLGGCGDCELVLKTLHDGYQCAYVPALRVTHLIPARRLNFQYLCRLSRAGQESWGRFLRLHHFRPAIPRWTLRLRQFKAFFNRRAWTRSGYIAWRGVCGYFTGLAL